MLSAVNDRVFTCIVPETTPVQKSPVLVVVIPQGHFVLLLEAGKGDERENTRQTSMKLCSPQSETIHAKIANICAARCWLPSEV